MMEEVNRLRLEQINKGQQATEAKSQVAKEKAPNLYRKTQLTKEKRNRADKSKLILASRCVFLDHHKGSDNGKPPHRFWRKG